MNDPVADYRRNQSQESMYQQGEPVAARTVSMSKVLIDFSFTWMAVALATSGGVAWYFAQSEVLRQFVMSYWLGLVIAELALVFFLSLSATRFNWLVGLACLLGYAALNGAMLSGVFLHYTVSSLETVFLITAGMFAGVSIFGRVTRMDLSGVGGICVMGLWGLIIATIANFFFASAQLDLIINYAGVVIFVGLTAWDVQKLRLLSRDLRPSDGAMAKRLGILGALTLYLDFINLFLFLLRLFGRRR